jgi:hypothetical protein
MQKEDSESASKGKYFFTHCKNDQFKLLGRGIAFPLFGKKRH